MNHNYLNNHPDKKLSYHIEGRNGSYSIDEYLNYDGEATEGCIRQVTSFKSRKHAELVCSEMQSLADKINKLRGF